MSFQPPQPPQQPPGWNAPPAAGPPAGGPPAFGAPQPATSPAPGRAHKPRMIAPAMIVAALVLIAVAVAVVLVARGGDDDGVDGKEASEGFDALADDAEYDDSGYFELRRCPLGDEDDLNERVADTLDLTDEVVDGDTYEYMSARDSDLPESVWCVAGADLSGGDVTDNIVYTASRLPRDDYDRFLEGSFPDGNVEVGDAQDYKGGTIYPYCFAPDDGGAGCGADWVDEDDDLAIGLNYSTDDDDPQAAIDALKDVLPDLAEALAEQS